MSSVVVVVGCSSLSIPRSCEASRLRKRKEREVMSSTKATSGCLGGDVNAASGRWAEAKD